MKNYFDEVKLFSIASGKPNTQFFDARVDSFEIRRVHFCATAQSKTIHAYVPFEDIKRLVIDLESGTVKKKLAQGSYDIFNNFKNDDKYAKINIGQSGDKIFVNSEGKDGIRISVATDLRTFASYIMYLYDQIQNYMLLAVRDMVKYAAEHRNENQQNANQQNANQQAQSNQRPQQQTQQKPQQQTQQSYQQQQAVTSRRSFS